MGEVQIPEPGTSKGEAELWGCKTSETSLYQLVAGNKQSQLVLVFVVCQDYSFSPGSAAADPPSRIKSEQISDQIGSSGSFVPSQSSTVS